MRTTIDIPPKLIQAVLKKLNFKSKREAVVFSLEQLLRSSVTEDLKKLWGKYDFDIDVKKFRGKVSS